MLARATGEHGSPKPRTVPLLRSVPPALHQLVLSMPGLTERPLPDERAERMLMTLDVSSSDAGGAVLGA